MKKILFTMLALVLMVGLALPMALPAAANGGPTKDYDNVTLFDWGSGNFPEIWDLTKCDLTLSYTLDMSAITNAGSSITEVGLREVGYPNIDPAYHGGFLLSKYASSVSRDDNADLNDLHVLMIHGWLDEYYDREGTFPGSPMSQTATGAYFNHAFWFDRDGVSTGQSGCWNYKDGFTYNTGGVYDVEIQYHANSATEGVMYVTINEEQQGFYTQVGGYVCGDPPETMPIGRTFAGDMTQMQVFYGRGSGGGTVDIEDIEVTGCHTKTVTLCAGQNIDAGTVTVWNDATNLYVKYETTSGWMLAETHVDVACGLGDIPQTKKNNPIPGHFAQGESYDPLVSEATFTFGLNTCGGGDIYVAAHAVVQKVITAAPYYAASVVDSWQGKCNNGTDIPLSWNRSNPDAVLDLDDPLWFFSLGFGESGNGWITVEFDCPIRNGDGNDVQVIEVTNANPYPTETANVYASQDGSTWTPLGQADNTGQAYPVGLTYSEFDLGALPWAKYIKVQDTTIPMYDYQGKRTDAFDLEVVVSLQDCIEIETAWGDGCEGTSFLGKNWATYFTF